MEKNGKKWEKNGKKKEKNGKNYKKLWKSGKKKKIFRIKLFIKKNIK